MNLMVQFDYAVIGGGIAGISVAAELATAHRVLVLEREPHLAYHTTGRSAAIYSETYGNSIICALTSASRAFFEKPPEGFSAQPLLRPRACLYIGRPDQAGQMDSAIADSQRGLCPLELLHKTAAYGLVPALRPGYVAVAALERNSADIDVHALHHGFQRLAMSRGAEIRRSAELMTLERSGSHWDIGVGADRYQAEVLVNAAGAWADDVGRQVGAGALGVTPMRRTMIVVDPPIDANSSDWPFVIDIGAELYFKPEGRKLLVSPADETPSPPCDAQPDELDIALCVDRLERALDISVARIDRSWAGLRSFCADRTPAVGFDKDVPGFFWLVGQGGYGIQTSPALSRVAAALARGQHLPPEMQDFGIDVSALDPVRLQPTNTT
ncbi:MAG: FAD-dependent oxidoreductase [Gammaproteobacteria bacterium]|jgi:D-arginine dehydrogenase|nr:FAD-dependent oxidoreductase [Gammaproteobacteria bacterium]